SMRRFERDGIQVSPLNRPRVKQFQVTGVYETSLENFDEVYVITDLNTARDLVGYQSSQVTRFDVTVENLTRVDEVARKLEEDLGFPVMARTIYEVWRGLFAWVD